MVGTITLALSLDNVYYLGEVKYRLNYIPQNIWIEYFMFYIYIIRIRNALPKPKYLKTAGNIQMGRLLS